MGYLLECYSVYHLQLDKSGDLSGCWFKVKSRRSSLTKADDYIDDMICVHCAVCVQSVLCVTWD